MPTNRVVLITGASSGFGKLTAEKLLDLGYIVYAAARNIEKMQDLKTKGALILKMAVTNNATVLSGVKQMVKEQNRIDILLNNAGYGSYGMIETVTIEELQYQYDVNVFGMARVLQAVLPYMRKQRSGRVIMTSSVVSQISSAGLGWYASTKHALNAMSVALRQEVKGLGIDVVMIEPGIVKTGFGNIAMATLDKTSTPADYQELLAGFRKYMEKGYENAPDPRSTVAAMVEAVTDDKPKTLYRTTMDARLYPVAKAITGDRIFDYLTLSQIMGASEE